MHVWPVISSVYSSSISPVLKFLWSRGLGDVYKRQRSGSVKCSIILVLIPAITLAKLALGCFKRLLNDNNDDTDYGKLSFSLNT